MAGAAAAEGPRRVSHGQGVDYSLKRWQALVQFVDDGDLPIDRGVYLTGPLVADAALNADLYYFGYEREQAAFLQTIANERRHTAGLRVFGGSDGIDWDIEVAAHLR